MTDKDAWDYLFCNYYYWVLGRQHEGFDDYTYDALRERLRNEGMKDVIWGDTYPTFCTSVHKWCRMNGIKEEIL